MYFSSHCSVWPCETWCWSCLTTKYKPKNLTKIKIYLTLVIMLWQENIPYIFSILLLANSISNDTWFVNNQNQYPLFEKVKVFPKLCVPKNMEIYMLSPIYLLNLIFCICMQLPFYKLWLSLPFKKNTSGKYITPHNLSCSKPFSKIPRWSWDSSKHHLVIIKCDHFYKIVLLIMEMVVWLIHVVWFVWS